jgi:hypothetical protein
LPAALPRDCHAVVVATAAWQSLPKASTDDFVQLFDIVVTELLPAL